MNKLFIFLSIFAALMLFQACDPEEPDVPNPEEVITTLTFTLTPAGGGDPLVMTFQDLDGDGGNAPIITADTLAANTVYTGSLTLLNEQKNPAEDISEEIKEEDEEHQFFFSTTVAGLTVEYNDQDADMNPVGLETTVTTTNAGTGTLTVILRHEPDKGAAGVADGDITNAGGETDIEVSFDVVVK